jgi:AhpC/TSA family
MSMHDGMGRDPSGRGERPMGMGQQLTRCAWLLGALLASGVVTANLATAIEVGEQAPDFTLPSTTGGMISLSQFRGKQLVLLEFHRNDFGGT